MFTTRVNFRVSVDYNMIVLFKQKTTMSTRVTWIEPLSNGFSRSSFNTLSIITIYVPEQEKFIAHLFILLPGKKETIFINLEIRVLTGARLLKWNKISIEMNLKNNKCRNRSEQSRTRTTLRPNIFKTTTTNKRLPQCLYLFPLCKRSSRLKQIRNFHFPR